MANPPTVNASHLGAAIDALATTNALFLMVLASREEIDGMLGLLDRMAETQNKGDGYDQIRAMVHEMTAKSIRDLQEKLGRNAPADDAATK